MLERPPFLVLAGHGVGPQRWNDDRWRLRIAPVTLLRLVDHLRSRGYDLVTFGELASSLAGPCHRPMAALTFDDGFADNVSHLAPLLAQTGVPATVFVVSGWLGRAHPDLTTSRILDPAEVTELAAAGVEIGTHTVSHPDLTTLGSDEIVDEFGTSRERLASLSSQPVRVAACPYGIHDGRVAAAAREAGIVALATSLGPGTPEHALDIPRLPIGPGASRTGLWLRADPVTADAVTHRWARRPRRWRRRLQNARDQRGTPR